MKSMDMLCFIAKNSKLWLNLGTGIQKKKVQHYYCNGP
jgi:hypothetical protein